MPSLRPSSGRAGQGARRWPLGGSRSALRSGRMAESSQLHHRIPSLVTRHFGPLSHKVSAILAWWARIVTVRRRLRTCKARAEYETLVWQTGECACDSGVRGVRLCRAKQHMPRRTRGRPCRQSRDTDTGGHEVRGRFHPQLGQSRSAKVESRWRFPKLEERCDAIWHARHPDLGKRPDGGFAPQVDERNGRVRLAWTQV